MFVFSKHQSTPRTTGGQIAMLVLTAGKTVDASVSALLSQIGLLQTPVKGETLKTVSLSRLDGEY